MSLFAFFLNDIIKKKMIWLFAGIYALIMMLLIIVLPITQDLSFLSFWTNTNINVNMFLLIMISAIAGLLSYYIFKEPDTSVFNLILSTKPIKKWQQTLCRVTVMMLMLVIISITEIIFLCFFIPIINQFNALHFLYLCINIVIADLILGGFFSAVGILFSLKVSKVIVMFLPLITYLGMFIISFFVNNYALNPRDSLQAKKIITNSVKYMTSDGKIKNAVYFTSYNPDYMMLDIYDVHKAYKVYGGNSWAWEKYLDFIQQPAFILNAVGLESVSNQIAENYFGYYIIEKYELGIQVLTTLTFGNGFRSFFIQRASAGLDYSFRMIGKNTNAGMIDNNEIAWMYDGPIKKNNYVSINNVDIGSTNTYFEILRKMFDRNFELNGPKVEWNIHKDSAKYNGVELSGGEYEWVSRELMSPSREVTLDNPDASKYKPTITNDYELNYWFTQFKLYLFRTAKIMPMSSEYPNGKPLPNNKEISMADYIMNCLKLDPNDFSDIFVYPTAFTSIEYQKFNLEMNEFALEEFYQGGLNYDWIEGHPAGTPDPLNQAFYDDESYSSGINTIDLSLMRNGTSFCDYAIDWDKGVNFYNWDIIWGLIATITLIISCVLYTYKDYR